MRLNYFERLNRTRIRLAREVEKTGRRCFRPWLAPTPPIAAGRLAVVIDRRFALEEAGEAHAYIESRQAFGRVLLVP